MAPADDKFSPPLSVAVDFTKQVEVEPIDMITSGHEEAGGQDDITVTPSLDRLDQVKLQHDLAKAVKSDDAEVPVHLWNAKICRGPVSAEQAKSLDVLRSFLLRIYRKRLW